MSGENSVESPKKLSWLDRLLTLWILLAMIIGVLIGNFIPKSAEVINSWTFGDANVNIPIAIGLILMMWPPLARVKYDQIIELFYGKKQTIGPDCVMDEIRKQSEGKLAVG